MKLKTIYIFIDVANVWNAQKSMRKFLEYSALKQNVKKIIEDRINQEVVVEGVFYYEAYPKDDTRDYDTDAKHRFMTYLKKALGFQVRKKPIKQIRVEIDGREVIEEKGNMDIELAVDAVHHQQKFDIGVFFTGDSDFFALTKYLMARGKKCYVFSSDKNISQELRTGTDGYFNVVKIPELWGNDLKYRDQKK